VSRFCNFDLNELYPRTLDFLIFQHAEHLAGKSSP
jgi:hypothetical protein